MGVLNNYNDDSIMDDNGDIVDVVQAVNKQLNHQQQQTDADSPPLSQQEMLLLQYENMHDDNHKDNDVFHDSTTITNRDYTTEWTMTAILETVVAYLGAVVGYYFCFICFL